MPKPPTPFNQEQADLLCGEIATHAESLKKIVGRLQGEHDGFPCIPVIYKWLRDIDAFADQYRACKADQADLFVDSIIDISDDETGDELGSVAVQRSKLKIWARQWVASKLRPTVYGDKINISANIDHKHSLGSLLTEIATSGQTSLIGTAHEDADLLLIPQGEQP